jgi:outer membrane protein insertion porin family
VLRGVDVVVTPAELKGDAAASLGLGVGDRLTDAALSSALERMLEHLAAQGFLDARIMDAAREPTEDPDGVRLRVVVDAGPLFTIASLSVTGAAALDSAEAARTLDVRPGDPFDMREVEEGINRLLQRYQGLGFPLASVVVDSLQVRREQGGATVALALRVREGARPALSRVDVEGLDVTSEEVVRKTARVDSRERFTGATAAAVKRRLEKLEIFDAVSDGEAYLTADTSIGLRYRVRERSPVRFDGILGYAPAGGSAAGGSTVTGLVDVRLVNLFGTARRLGVRWYRPGYATQEISVHYVEPWVASLPLQGTAEVVQRKQDTSYVRWEFSVQGEMDVSDAVGFSATLSRTSIVPTEAGRRWFEASRLVLGGAAVRVDTRDNRRVPRSGVFYRTSYEAGSKAIDAGVGGVARREQSTRITADLECAVELWPRHVLTFAAHGREFRSSTQDPGNFFRLGGATTLRGYREDQFAGTRVGWGGVEYRLLTSPFSYLCVFLDGGYVRTPTLPGVGLAASELTRVGYGVGSLLETRIGMLGISLALGEGDTYRTAKFHLRLVNDF